MATQHEHIPPTAVADDGLWEMFEWVQEANTAFLTGNPVPTQELWSHAEDVSIYGGWGDYEVGWEEVAPRLEWAAARYVSGELTYELLAMGVSGDLGYTIAIQRGEALLAGQASSAPIALRVTHLYRREDDEWKIIHFHADHCTRKMDTTAVLQ